MGIKWVLISEKLPDYMSDVLVVGRMRYAWEKDYTYFMDYASFHPDDVWYLNNDWYEGQQEYELLCWSYLPDIPYDFLKEVLK